MIIIALIILERNIYERFTSMDNSGKCSNVGYLNMSCLLYCRKTGLISNYSRGKRG